MSGLEGLVGWQSKRNVSEKHTASVFRASASTSTSVGLHFIEYKSFYIGF